MLIENLFLIPIIIFLVGIINKFFLDAKKEFKPHLNSSRNKLIINGKDVKNREKHKQKKNAQFLIFLSFSFIQKCFFFVGFIFYSNDLIWIGITNKFSMENLFFVTFIIKMFFVIKLKN